MFLCPELVREPNDHVISANVPSEGTESWTLVWEQGADLSSLFTHSQDGNRGLGLGVSEN